MFLLPSQMWFTIRPKPLCTSQTAETPPQGKVTCDCFTWSWCQEQHPPSNGTKPTNKPSATIWDLVKPAAGWLAHGLVPNSVWNGDVTSCATSSARNSLALKQPAVLSSELLAAEILPKTDQYSAAALTGVGGNDGRSCCCTILAVPEAAYVTTNTTHSTGELQRILVSAGQLLVTDASRTASCCQCRGAQWAPHVPPAWLHLPRAPCLLGSKCFT